jgi:hypothetical protein
VIKGFDYREVGVMIGTDIYGWAFRVHRGGIWPGPDRSRLGSDQVATSKEPSPASQALALGLDSR